MKKNEFEFCESIVNHNSHIYEAQQYIKENFGINSTFDNKNNELHLCEDVDDLNLVAAKNYLKEAIGEDKIIVL